MMDGRIKLHRKIVERERYNDINVRTLFFHLLIFANHKPKKWRGEIIEAGELVTGYSVLSSQCGLSIMQTRTAIEKLKSTGEIEQKVTSKGQRIKLLNYTKYQDQYSEYNKQATSKQQTNNKQITTNKNDKNIRKKERKNKEVEGDKKTGTKFTPPTLIEIEDYITTRRSKISPDRFFSYYESNGRMVGKNKMKDWQAAIRSWETRDNLGPPSAAKVKRKTYAEHQAEQEEAKQKRETIYGDFDDLPF